MAEKEYIERESVLEIVKRTSGDYAAAWSAIRQLPAADVAPVVHGEWELEAHNGGVNFRWYVTAKCPSCGDNLGKIWVGFFPDVPDSLAERFSLDCAERVVLANYCRNCGAKMNGGKANE